MPQTLAIMFCICETKLAKSNREIDFGVNGGDDGEQRDDDNDDDEEELVRVHRRGTL